MKYYGTYFVARSSRQARNTIFTLRPNSALVTRQPIASFRSRTPWNAVTTSRSLYTGVTSRAERPRITYTTSSIHNTAANIVMCCFSLLQVDFFKDVQSQAICMTVAHPRRPSLSLFIFLYSLVFQQRHPSP